MEGGARSTDLVRVNPYGLFHRFVAEMRALAADDRLDEALPEIDRYEWIAERLGDHATVDLLVQRRMYTYLGLGQHDAALAVGTRLAGRRRAAGNVLGEARTLADLAELYILTGRETEGMRCLARASLLVERTSRREHWYGTALASCGDAAMAASLYEVAAAFYEGYHAHLGSNPNGVFEDSYSALLASWALWLDHLGHTFEAEQRWRRIASITGDWLSTYGDRAAVRHAHVITGARALALAKLGQPDEAMALAQPLTTHPHSPSYTIVDAWLAHLALALVWRDHGDHGAARRELLVAEHLVARRVRADDRLLVQRELAMLNAELLGHDGCADVLAALRSQARHLWQLRRQRLSMLHQARQREELEAEQARSRAALLRDPLTGLGNRRRFDELLAGVATDDATLPLTLVVIDVDRFKAINDTYAHSVGDEVLRELARIVAAQCRTGRDTAVRFAGDEFALFLNADLADAVEVAERIRTAVASADFGRLVPGMAVSISTGVAVFRAGMTGQDLFYAADRNLYRAKRSGRNRVAA